MSSKLLTYLLLTSILIVLLIAVFLVCQVMYEYEHPVVCKYHYVDLNNNTGTARLCDITPLGNNYCRINVKQVITVKKYKKVCKRI